MCTFTASMCVCVCVRARMHVCVCVHACMCMYVCVHAEVYAGMHAHTVQVYTSRHTYVCVWLYVNAYRNLCAPRSGETLNPIGSMLQTTAVICVQAQAE